MAAARAGRPIAYYTFGDTQVRDSIVRVYDMLSKHNVTVGKTILTPIKPIGSVHVPIMRGDLFTILLWRTVKHSWLHSF